MDFLKKFKKYFRISFKRFPQIFPKRIPKKKSYLGTLVLSTLVPWYLGSLVHWYLVTWYLVPFYFGTQVPWYLGTLVPLYLGTLVPWYFGTLVHCASTKPCHSSNHRVTTKHASSMNSLLYLQHFSEFCVIFMHYFLDAHCGDHNEHLQQ